MLEMLFKVDPDLSLIKTYLNYSKINPKVIPIIIDQLNLVAQSGGYGSVIIEIADNKVLNCRGISERRVDLDINSEVDIVN
jgi:hypothetical protein